MDGLTWLFGTSNYSKWINQAERIIQYSKSQRVDVDGYQCSLKQNGRVRVSGHGIESYSDDLNEMVAYFIVLGGTVNTLFEPSRSVAVVLNYKNFINDRRPLLGKKLDSVYHPYSDLTQGTLDAISRSPLNTDQSWSMFLKAVAQYLGRPPTVTDFSGKGNIPVAEVSKKVAEYGSLVKKYPLFFEGYIKEYSSVIDAKADQSKMVAMRLYTDYVASLSKAFHDSKMSRFLSGSGKELAEYELLRSRPASLNFEDRVIWLHIVANKIKSHCDVFFNQQFVLNEDELIQAVDIKPTDKIHELSKFMILLLKETLVNGNTELTLKALGETILTLLESNKSNVTTFTESACLLAVYWSVVGTNPRRIRSYPERMTFVVDGVIKNVDFKAALLVAAAKGESLGINALRVFSRKLSTLTFLLRKKGKIHTEIWSDVSLMDNSLNFDTVNCLDLSLIKGVGLRDIEVCREKIQSGGTSRGKLFADNVNGRGTNIINK